VVRLAPGSRQQVPVRQVLVVRREFLRLERRLLELLELPEPAQRLEPSVM